MNGSSRQGSHSEAEARILTVSNRGPVEYHKDETGNIFAVQGQGGLATALRVAARFAPTTWLSSPLTALDREIASGEISPPALGSEARFVLTDPVAYDLFYGCFANEVLWFLQHGMQFAEDLSPERVQDAWQNGYLEVNRAFADATVAEVNRSNIRAVLIHDYHFYAAPRMVRQHLPDIYLQHFVHIPWPGPNDWRRLDESIRRKICDGLLANDSLVFQSCTDVRNFLLTVQVNLKEAEIDFETGRVSYSGRQTRVWANGISADPEELMEEAASSEFARYRYLLRGEPGEKLILRVDRLDPAKNPYRGFLAYERLLENHPELKGKVLFLALLVPTKSDITVYQRYQKETHDLANAINQRQRHINWRPIRVLYEHNRTQALAALSLYDVLLINSVADGMNLVAKEGPILNQKDGVLVLSDRTGAWDDLSEGAIGIDPFDVEATAEALYRALTMQPIEKYHRARLMRKTVHAKDLKAWFQRLLADMEEHSSQTVP